ncbi:hypothetical protein FSP39_003562 [Pinctada imbricata]|uniref:G-protein coupled receptors family 1 profile domain-containing protein n=1 Tax=Pinctada imbricata TaxID=66713 RepID=A0AA89BYN5_PINIB|nr:hypothetical protein FSP39_003562 [Pinctada imbricata]
MPSRLLLNLQSDLCNTTTTGVCVSTNTDVGLSLMALMQGITLVLALSTNGIVCVVFYKKPHLLSVNNSFVLNLSCCQLLMAMLIVPFSMISIFSTKWIFNDAFCAAQAYLLTSCIVTTQLSLMVISIDRNYAIIHSLRYPYVFTQRRANFLISTTWSLGFVISLPPLIGWGKFAYITDQHVCGLDWTDSINYLIFFSCLTFLVPLFVQSWCYLSIFRAALGHSKRNSRVYPSMPSSIQRDPPSDCSDCSDVSQTTPPQYRNVECKAVRTILFIACAYSLCWVPYFVASYETIQNNDIPPLFSSFAISAVFLSTVVNPVIYAFFNRVTRYEINKFFCDNARRINGRTTTGEETDEYYSTTVTNFSSSRQNPSVWTNRQKTQTTIKPKGIEMNTIDEEAEIKANMRPTRSNSPTKTRCQGDRCTIKESVSLDVTKLTEHATPASQVGISVILQSSFSVTEHTSPNRKRATRAQSEFLTGRDTFYKKSLKDCGSFLFFESHHEGKHERPHFRSRNNIQLQPHAYRQRSNSQLPIYNRLAHCEHGSHSSNSFTGKCEMSGGISNSSIHTWNHDTEASFSKLSEEADDMRSRSNTAASDNTLILSKQRERLDEYSKDRNERKHFKSPVISESLSKSVSRRILERNIQLKNNFQQYLSRSSSLNNSSDDLFRDRTATVSSDSSYILKKKKSSKKGSESKLAKDRKSVSDEQIY